MDAEVTEIANIEYPMGLFPDKRINVHLFES